jgi:hypothetical protein
VQPEELRNEEAKQEEEVKEELVLA